MIKNPNSLLISQKRLSNIRSIVLLKNLGDIDNHDGVGEKLAVHISVPNRAPIMFFMETDYWSGELVKSSPIFNTSSNNFADLSNNTPNLFSLPTKYLENSITLELFEESIKNLSLDITFGDFTTLDDFIITLNTKDGKLKTNLFR